MFTLDDVMEMRKGDTETDLHSDYPLSLDFLSLDFNTQNNQIYENPDTTLNNKEQNEDGGNLRSQLDKAQMYSIHIQLPNLTIAAEIGQHLLQANAALKTAYQDLLNYSKKHMKMEPTRTADEILRDVLMDVNPFETREDEYNTDDDSVTDEVQYEAVQDLQSLNSASTALEAMGDLASPMMLNVVSSLELEKAGPVAEEIQNVSSPPINSRKSVKRNTRPKSSSSYSSHQQYPTDIHEYISSLEYVNADLNSQLKRNREIDTLRIKKLEAELDQLRSELQQTLNQLTDLEKEKKRLMRERIEFSREQSQLEQTDREIIDELFSRVQIAEEKYELAISQKKELNKKIDNVFRDLLFLRQRCSDLEAMLYDSEYLREFSIRQTLNIEDLKEQLEEERNYNAQLLMERSAYSGGGFGDFDHSGPQSPSTDTRSNWFRPSSESDGKTYFNETTNNSPSVSNSGVILERSESKTLNSHQIRHALSKSHAGNLYRSGSHPEINISLTKSPSLDEWTNSPDSLYPPHQFWAGPNMNKLSGMGLRSVTNVGIGGVGPLKRPLMPSPLTKTFVDNASEDTFSVISIDPADDNISRRPQFVPQQQHQLQSVDDHHINHTLESDSELKYGYFSPRSSRPGTPNGRKISVTSEVRRARTLSVGSAGAVADEKILTRDGHGVLVDKWFTMCWNLVYKPADSSP
ncbi:hypothetical protein HK096_005236 [Nowakowskiella sp. JEL0078]|nr:hypothetical protein HK096_005236 [Nowakowskiella sp. JEL0078]